MPMTTTTAALDMEIVHGFAFKVFGDLTAQQMGALTTVGDRLGLFTSGRASTRSCWPSLRVPCISAPSSQ